MTLGDEVLADEVKIAQLRSYWIYWCLGPMTGAHYTKGQEDETHSGREKTGCLSPLS